LGVEIQRHLGDLGGHRKVAFAVRIGKGLHNLPVPIDTVLLAETAVVGHHRQSRVFGPVEDGLGSGDRVAHPQYLLIAVDCQGQCSSATQRQASALKRSTAGEDAEAGADEAVELGSGRLQRVPGEAVGAADAVEREGAQRAGALAVGDQVPVVAIAQQALGVDAAVADDVAPAAVVPDAPASARPGTGVSRSAARAGGRCARRVSSGAA